MATKSSLTSTRSPSAAKPPIGPVKVLPPVLAVSVPPPPPEVDAASSVTPYSLISQAKNAIQFANVKVQRLKEGFEAVKSDLNLLVKGEEAEAKKNEEGRFLQTSARKEAVVDTLFSHVKKAVFMADAQIDKFCFKRRGNYTQTECKKGVTAALEKMANDIWNSLMSAMDKPVSSKLTQSIKALNSLQKELDELTKGVEESLGKAEEALYEHCEEQGDVKALTERRGEATERRRSDETESVTSRVRQPSPAVRKFREQFTSELQAEGQRMLNSFQRFTGNRKATRNQTFGLRKEMDDIMKDMVVAVQASYPRIGRSEDADTWRMKKEVLRIRQRIDQLCKNMEDPEGIVPVHDTSTFSSPAPAVRLGRGGMQQLSEDFDSMSEVSDRSRARSQAVSASWDPEELKQEFSRQMKESQRSVISVIKEQHQSITTVSQSQSTLQLKQELLNADVAEIRKKLNDLFPGAQARSKVVDLSKTIAVLKAFAPDIRATNDQEFMEKFTRQISTERQETEAFMSAVRGEGYTFATLDDVAKEFTHLKESYASLREDHDEFLLKMIRTQSEYELEVEYHKSANQQLQSELQHLRDSMQALENSEDRERIRTLETENEELKLVKQMQFEQLDEKIMLDDESQTDPVKEKTIEVTVEKIVKVPEKVYVEKTVEKVVTLPKPVPKIQRIRGLSIKGLSASARKPTVRFAEEAPETIVFTQDFGPDVKSPEPETVMEEGDEVVGVTEEHPQEMLVGSSAEDSELPSRPSDDIEPAEVCELREEINNRVGILKAITDEEQAIELKMAALQDTSEFETMRELSKSLTEAHRRYDEAFSEIESMQEKIEKLSPKKQAKESPEEISMQTARDSLAEEIRSLLDIHVPFEVCGTTTYAACEWALVRLADTYVWVRHTLPRPELSNEEMIAHCLEASYMMEPYAILPRHLVLATGYLLDLLKDKMRK